MKIILKEEKLPVLFLELLKEYNISDGNAYHNPYNKPIEIADNALDDFIYNYGTVMIDIQNGKEYLVFEVDTLSKLIGKRYCICKLIKDGKPFGIIYVKPFINFRIKNY